MIDRTKCADPASMVGNRVKLGLSVATGRFPSGEKGVTVLAPRWRGSANQKHTGTKIATVAAASKSQRGLACSTVATDSRGSQPAAALGGYAP